MRFRSFLPFFAALAVAVGLASVAAASDSPTDRLAAMNAALRSEHSVHYVSAWRAGAKSVTMVCDVGRTSGIQRITFARSGKKGHVTVIVAGRTAYVRGDAFTLEGYMGFSAANAKRLAGKWLVVPSSNAAYASVADDVTYASATTDLAPDGRPIDVAGKPIDGKSVRGVRGTSRQQGQPVVDTLWIAAKGKPLPVLRTIAGGAGVNTIEFSDWGKPVNVRAPRGAVKPTKPQPTLPVA